MTLDDDLSIRLERIRTARRLTFKQALNETLRRGLAAAEEGLTAEQPGGRVTATRPLPLGRRLAGDIDSVAQALAIAEGEAFG